MHHIILLSACSITATINTVKSCIMKSYNGRPFPKKAYQIQILLAIWPNKFHFLNFTLDMVYCWPSPWVIQIRGKPGGGLGVGVVNPCPVQYHTLYMDYNCLQRTYWYRPAHPVGVAKATPAA